MNNQKFRIQCYIGGGWRETSQHRLTFSHDAPGRAVLVVKGTASPNQMVAVELGWGDNLRRVFTGYIDRVSPDNPGYSRLFCRELAAVLYHPLTVVLRHPTLMQLLSNVTAQTGLQFVVPERAYAQSAIPCFYSTGNGYRVLDEIADAFGIRDYLWQQQGNGQIFVGSWADSYWAGREVEIPDALWVAGPSGREVTVPCSPHFKPGTMVNGRRLATVEHRGTDTEITWT